MSFQKFKLIFFAPPTALQQCKAAIFQTGAGTIGNYSECCFTTPGVGQFRPGKGAHPHLGTPGALEEVGEVRCELMCSGEQQAKDAVSALKSAHPYEEVAYEVYRIEDF